MDGWGKNRMMDEADSEYVLEQQERISKLKLENQKLELEIEELKKMIETLEYQLGNIEFGNGLMS